MKKLYYFTIFFTFILLSSCATMSPQMQSQWDKRQTALTGIKGFALNGKIAVRTTNNAFSADLYWLQQGPNYRISLFGPMGTHSYEISGQPGYAQLASGTGQRAYARTPESLLAKTAGWGLPVSDLYYWIRGVPVPNIPAQKQMDTHNHIVLLKQDGWIVRYLDYSNVNNTDVPRRIFLTNPQLDVRIVINQWQL